MREWIQEEHREHKMYAGADGEAIPEEFREARNKGLYYLQLFFSLLFREVTVLSAGMLFLTFRER